MFRIFIISAFLLISPLAFADFSLWKSGGPAGSAGYAQAAESDSAQALLGGLKNMAVNAALEGIKDTVIAKYMAGIGTVEKIDWHGDTLSLLVRLDGISEAIEVDCSDIKIAPSGATVSVGKFASNMPFAQTLLSRYVAGRVFQVPAGEATLAVLAAKKVLGI